MHEDTNLRNAETVLSQVFGENGLHLRLVLNGVNKTLTGKSLRGEFYLRLSPEQLHSKFELQREARILALVAEHNPTLAASPFPDHQQAGTAFAWDDKTYFGIATTVAPGETYDESPDQLKRFGGALASLHGIPLPVNWKRDAGEQPLGLPLQDSGDEHLSAEIRQVSSAAAAWTHRNSSRQSGRLSIRHGDAWPGNCRFSESAVTLFDFEHASIGDPVADFANVAWWLTGLQQPSEAKAKLWSSFLAGYEEGSHIPDLSSLPYHVLQVELRSLVFLRDFIRLSPEVTASVSAGAHQLVGAWQDRVVPDSGFMPAGW